MKKPEVQVQLLSPATTDRSIRRRGCTPVRESPLVRPRASLEMFVGYYILGGTVISKTYTLGIPESQLQTWAQLPSSTAAEATHTSIRTLLEGSPRLRRYTFDTFLQGSYRNYTNIRANSDVDIVVRLTSVFEPDYSSLPWEERLRKELQASKASYGLSTFRADVLHVLREQYGYSAVTDGDKCLKVIGTSSGSRLPADVLPAMLHSKFFPNNLKLDGIVFYTQRTGRQVVNYPIQHYDNGALKHQATGNNFKPAVRMFKNAREKAIGKRYLLLETAPSYFVQCLFFNVPDSLFSSNLRSTYIDVVNHLLSLSPQQLSQFLCQNRAQYLFGDTPEQWDIPSALVFVKALERLWDNWT